MPTTRGSESKWNPKVNKYSEKVVFEKYFWNGRMVGKQKSGTTSGPSVPVLEPFVFTTRKSRVQRLDTGIA